MYWLFYFTMTFVAFTAAEDDMPCTARDGNSFYDLNPLSSRDGYKFWSPDGQEFVMNVCNSVSYDPWNIHVPNPENVAGVTRKARGDFSIGEVNRTLIIRHKHPLLILTGGSPCPHSENVNAMTAVRFICDTSVFAAGSPQLVAQLPPTDDDSCAFFLEWRTHYACPTGEASGFWGGLVVALAIIAVILLVIYVVGGTLYNRFVLHKQGFDQLPRISIFSFVDTLDAISGFCDRMLGHRAQPRYRSGSSSRDEETSQALSPGEDLDEESGFRPETLASQDLHRTR